MRRLRLVAASAGVVVLFLLVQLGSLALLEPFHAAEYQPVENPDDPTNSLLYIGAILVATVMMLAAIRYDLEWLIRAAIIAASAMLAWFVLSVIAPPVFVGSVNVIALAAALAIAAGLLVYPEWYVIDAAGVVMGAGAAALFGIAFGPLPALVLLVVLAVYDAISVYGTEHMLTLAEGVMDQRVPVLFVIPVSLSYSFLDATAADEGGDERNRDEKDAGSDAAEEATENDAGDDSPADEPPTDDDADGDDSPTDETDSVTDSSPLERDALFIGLGDAVIPGVLVASAAFFLPAEPLAVPGILINLPALGAMLGTIVGLIGLLVLVFRGRAHAGLPLLNGGAIAGYLLGAVAAGIPLATAIGI